MNTRQIVNEQIEILANLSREIADGRLTVSADGRDYYSLLPEIGSAIARLCELAEK